jgi:hypothetical protein
MSPQRRTPLNAGTVITLDATGTGTARLGPGSQQGPANWHVDGVILANDRPGKSPIPRVVVYVDDTSAGNKQGVSYDGSFAQGSCDIPMIRGQQLLAIWTGGQAGDKCEFTVTGQKW